MLEQQLQRIGLSEKEAKVYLASLELGPSPVQKIAAKAHVNRATTYVILEGLMKKGVITIFDQGKKRYFVAEGPNSLKNIISQQQKELDEKEQLLETLHSQLQSVYNVLPNKPVVKFYEGKEGLKTIIEERLHDAPKEVDIFSPIQDVQNVFSDVENEEFRKKRIEQNVFHRVVFSIDDTQKELKFPLSEVKKVSHQELPFHCDISIFNDKVAISILKGHSSGIVIENKAVADTFRSIFELAFRAAK